MRAGHRGARKRGQPPSFMTEWPSPAREVYRRVAGSEARPAIVVPRERANRVDVSEMTPPLGGRCSCYRSSASEARLVQLRDDGIVQPIEPAASDMLATSLPLAMLAAYSTRRSHRVRPNHGGRAP